LSAIDNHGSSRGSWKISPIRGDGAASATPSSVTRPRNAVSRPATIRSNVLFPQPLGPTIQTISPCASCSAMSARIGRSP